MSDDKKYPVWPVLTYIDGPAAIAFLEQAFGFERIAVYTEPDDHRRIVHAELRWPEGGGVMLGSAGSGEEPFSSRPTGAASTYLVTADPDGLHERARTAGAEIVRPLRDESYGSRGFTAADPEGNLWSFGTYAGEG